jgi:chemotaxis protein methyltransferase WspC
LPRPPPASVISENIERANRLADGGFLREAEEICKEILKTDAPNARAHFLLGLIREAQDNNPGAEECFHRAIYLDAGFAEAILHLAALKEKNGDNSAAVLLRRRAAAINARNVRKK